MTGTRAIGGGYRGTAGDRPMTHALALKRWREPPDPHAQALAFYSLVAAAGFAVGWAAQALGGF